MTAGLLYPLLLLALGGDLSVLYNLIKILDTVHPFAELWQRAGVSTNEIYAIRLQVIHTCNPSMQEAKAGGSLSLRPSWAT
jgi:hypothetical protein